MSQPCVFKEAAFFDAHAIHLAAGKIFPWIPHVFHIADQQLSMVFDGVGAAGDGGGPKGGGDGAGGWGCGEHGPPVVGH